MTQRGEYTAADRGLELAELKKGSRILEIGCGSGETVFHLVKEKGMQAEGIDSDLKNIQKAKEQYPDIDVHYGEASFLDGYMSFTFDGVLMEDVLSGADLPDEALHEAWCVLKKGGKLIICDLYERDPDPERLRALKAEAERQARMLRKEGDCEEPRMRTVDFRREGVLFREPLIRQLEDLGFSIMAEEDLGDDPGQSPAGRLLLAAEKPL